MGAHLEQRQHLLGDRDDGELLGRDPVDPGRVEHREEVALDLRPGLLEAALGVDLLDVEVRGDLGGLRPDRQPEGVGERVGRVGGEDQGAVPGAAAAVAVPAAAVVLPTPPLPVKRMVRTVGLDERLDALLEALERRVDDDLLGLASQHADHRDGELHRQRVGHLGLPSPRSASS